MSIGDNNKNLLEQFNWAMDAPVQLRLQKFISAEDIVLVLPLKCVFLSMWNHKLEDDADQYILKALLITRAQCDSLIQFMEDVFVAKRRVVADRQGECPQVFIKSVSKQKLL